MTVKTQNVAQTKAAETSDNAFLQHEKEKAPLRRKSAPDLVLETDRLGIQTKLTLGTPGDFHEREADRIAENIVSNPSPVPHAFSISPLIQRQITSEEEEEEEIQAKAISPVYANKGGLRLNDQFSRDLASAGPGAPLSAHTRAFFEPRFGRDLSDIRVHDGASANDLSKSIHANAFTRRTDIYFGAGHYAPETPKGRLLLAHELVHTVQQTGGKSAPDIPHVQRNGPTVNPEIAGLPAVRYVDAFSEVNYDLDYRAVGGNLSRFLTITYADGAQIDIDLFTIEDRDVDMIEAMANGTLGELGRIFPSDMTRTTVPRLWAARTEAIAIMEQYNYEFMMAAMPAVIFIITLAGMPPLTGSSPVVRRTTRPRPTRPAPSPAPAAAAGGSGRTAASGTASGGAGAVAAGGGGGGASIFRLLSDRVMRYSGRDVVVVMTRRGPQAFYRRTGMGGTNAGGAQAGQWAPFDGILARWFDKSRYVTGAADDVLYRFGTAENRQASEWLGQQTIRHGDDVGEVFSLLNQFLDDLGALRL